MNENGTKRREWVKNAAIVFLTVMLLLTFFSQTIMNYSLPEVATQYVQSGSITAKIRGSGVVESGDPYEVKVTESRKVASVAVRQGDMVQKGDVLFYLEDKDSDELKAALDELEKAEGDYEKALLSTDLTASDIQTAENGISLSDYRNQITVRQNAVKAAKDAVKAAENDVKEAQRIVNEKQNWYDAFTTQISIEGTVNTAEEQHAVDEAKRELEDARNYKAEMERERDRVRGELQGIKDNISNLERELEAAIREQGEESDRVYELRDNLQGERDRAAEYENNYIPDYDRTIGDLEREIPNKEQALKDAENRLEAKKNEDKTQIVNNLKYQQSIAGAELADAKEELTRKQSVVTERQTALTEKEKELSDFKSQIDRVGNLQSMREAIDKAQEKVDELREKTTGTTIVAPISGTVSSLNVAAGNTTSAATPVAVMQPEGKGYTLSFSVTNEQAKRLSVGDRADLVNAWRYDDLTVTLASIKPDKNDPSQKKQLTFDVTGNGATVGLNLSLSVGQKSANYDLIVPNSAIREDNNGKFILIVESKASPLGTRYTASRVDVEVLASDDTQSAISAALYGYEFVITTSTKPVEAGKLVRLASS